MSKENDCDVLIVGAGPSGLAAASCCLHEGRDFIVVEKGPKLDRRNYTAEHMVIGEGGAGLFSDGKLSYFPSSHLLWNLQSNHFLQNAYSWLHNLISDFYSDFPEYPKTILQHGDCTVLFGKNARKKDYFSFVMSPEQRKLLLARLLAPIKHKIVSGYSLFSLSKEDSVYSAAISNLDNPIDQKVVTAKQVIFCGGRFGPIALRQLLPNLSVVFRRFEYGIRIEQPKNDFFLRDWPNADAKILFQSKDRSVEWRTFCCCREGTVLSSRFDDFITCSGTALLESSESNIGFNVRICDSKLYSELLNEIKSINYSSLVKIDFGAFLAGRTITLFGHRLDQFLREGLNLLVDKFGPLEANIYSPCLEGMGYYPVISTDLETEYQGLYIAGDSSGLFRGLLPALLSGFYSAKVASVKRLDNCSLITGLRINTSDTNRLPMVFTAQSKKYFYCRDAVCEYVFNQGKLPINPFRVFDYFLSDRIPRDLVRQGNNHLVRACDELWVFGPVADGVLFEVMHALNLNKPVMFFNIGARASEISPIEDINEIKFEPEVHSSHQKRKHLLEEITRAFDMYKRPKQLKIQF